MFESTSNAGESRNGSIDTFRSRITVHVGKEGLLRAFGHEHVVEARICSGQIGDSSIVFTIRAGDLIVQPHPAISAEDHTKIQSTLLNNLLEVSRFPEIRFRSTNITGPDSTGWSVTGSLELHGVEKPIAFSVARKDGGFAGSVDIKQSEFGIERQVVAGGLVRVKDEVTVGFEVFSSVLSGNPHASR